MFLAFLFIRFFSYLSNTIGLYYIYHAMCLCCCISCIKSLLFTQHFKYEG